jgi:tetratricopeptide (TPR) repeat protein
MDKSCYASYAAARAVLREDFADGLKCFLNDDFAGALVHFRAADKDADISDGLQSRYTSFHGLSRVCLGDNSGIKLCRKAAAGEVKDAEVYYNLALAEYRLDNLESAVTALRRGLYLDPKHTGLLRLQRDMSLREPRIMLPGLPQTHPVNRLLGKVFGRRRTGSVC